MENLQGLNVPVWKTPLVIDEVIKRLESIEITALEGLPTMEKYWTELTTLGRFKEQSLEDGYIITSVTTEGINYSVFLWLLPNSIIDSMFFYLF